MARVMKQERQNADWSTIVLSDGQKVEADDKLISARIKLLFNHPFFGNLATRMRLIDGSKWCKTLATDGRNFYFNYGFLSKLSVKEAEYGFAHEVLHNVFDHMTRREGRDPIISNIAADYAVNQILKDEKIGSPPSFMQVYQDDKYRHKSYEEIYDDLISKAKKIDLKTLGELLDEHLDGDGDEDGRPTLTAEEKRQIRDEIKEAMISAAQSTEASKMPGSISRLINNLTQPIMDWRELLRMNIQSIIKHDFSFQRYNRKSQQCGAILPGMTNEETIDVTVAIDMSGSISDEQGTDFISEVKGIMEEYADFKLDLFCFDTSVYNYHAFTSDTLYDIDTYKVAGGGGTDFDCVWKFMKKEDILPKRLIMFTDGYPCGSWGDELYCDTLFVIHGNESIVAPFGQTAYYK